MAEPFRCTIRLNKNNVFERECLDFINTNPRLKADLILRGYKESNAMPTEFTQLRISDSKQAFFSRDVRLGRDKVKLSSLIYELEESISASSLATLWLLYGYFLLSHRSKRTTSFNSETGDISKKTETTAEDKDRTLTQSDPASPYTQYASFIVSTKK